MTTLRPDNPRSESNSSQNLLINKQTGTNSRDHNGWKPWTLKAPALSCLFITTLVLAAVVEFLYQKSQKQGGGLALSGSPGDIPPLVNLAYLYLPTIVAVLYSLAWNWVASDSKRIQPWLEMSKPEGALAEDSLLLDYPSTFFAWVPFRAASKRHWPVFLSGMIVLIVTCTITPLQGAILKIEKLSLSVDSPFLVTSGLPPVNRQSLRMDATLLNTAYATTFLDQSMPPFTTPNYALLPARFQGGSELVNKDTNFTVTTTRLTTDLECRPATATWLGAGTIWEFDNGRGCRVGDVPIEDSSVYTMHYIGWQTNSWSEYGLNQTGHCSEENRHQVLVIWARRYSPSSFIYPNASERHPGNVDITASFCEPRYWKQPVLVSLSSNQSVLHAEHNGSMQPLGAAERLDHEFNTTAFESFLSGAQPPDMPDGGEGSSFIYRVSSDRHFMGIGLQRTLANVIGFALGKHTIDLSVYKDAELLKSTFEAMHQTLFSLTVARINSLEASPGTNNVTGIATVPRYGITVSRRFAIAVESLLLAVALLNLGLLWSCRSGNTKLLFDPDSIKGLASLVRRSNALKMVMSETDAESYDGLRHALYRRRFYLRDEGDAREVQIDIMDLPNAPQVNNNHSSSHLYTPDIPATMKPLSGLAFVLVLVAAMSCLTYLKVIERRSQGLPLPMISQLTLEILENYIPIVFATLVQSFLVLLNRLLATIQPFSELHRGRSPSSNSICLEYTSLPPQLLFWRAAKAKHLLLGIVCLVAIIGNALSVSLGALFNELPVVKDEAIEIPELLTPTITKNSLDNLMRQVHASPNGYSDHWTIAEVYWTTGTRLPPWLTEDFFFTF
ncbi:uncharacterized protein PG998_008344 [Apiospora kogelbergensis]|uniref:uncharacterized protein n=1 Tax=Apiospora kogelbergensis TaxID=1337665 RepID=UPI003131E52B